MTPLEQLKFLTKEKDEALLSLLLEKAKAEIELYLNQEPTEKYDSLAVDMAVVKFNRIGTEGLSAQSFSGASETFLDSYPDYIQSHLNRLRKRVHFL